MRIKIENNKTMAFIDDLRLWPKNPRVIENKNLTRLKNQILELGVYKPLVVTSDGEIMGGNQRFKVLKELAAKDENYKWIWISEIEAWTDEDRLKYALSDNFSAGEYTREQLAEVINVNQASLFKDYCLEFGDQKTVEDFISELAISDEEVKFKQISKDLQKMGVNEETVEVIKQMTDFNKQKEVMENPEIKGQVMGIKNPLVFWFEDETLWNQLCEIFKTSQKHKANEKLLVEYVEVVTGTKLPTDVETLTQLTEKATSAAKNLADFKDLGGNKAPVEAELASLKEKIKNTYKNIFKENL